MDQVIAKVKRLRKNPYKKLLSDTSLFRVVDASSVSLVEYSPMHSLDEDAWFQVAGFSKKDFFLSILRQSIDAKNFDEISKEKFSDVSALLSLQGDDVYFQKVNASSFIRRKVIAFGEVATIEEGARRIVVKETPDAVYFRGSDVLIFKDIATVSSIFVGIDQLYREATDAQVSGFLSSDFIELAGDYNVSSVSKPNRKRLALVIDTLSKMPAEQKNNLVSYIKGYCGDAVEVTDSGDCFKISSDRQLKLVLYGIEERFYTTQHSKERRLANSIEKMG